MTGYTQLTHTGRYQILALQRTGFNLAGIALELNRHVSRRRTSTASPVRSSAKSSASTASASISSANRRARLSGSRDTPTILIPAMPQNLWKRDETLLALRLYMVTPFGRIHTWNPDIVQLAEAIGRTPGSVSRRMTNLAALDSTITSTGRVGSTHYSKLDRDTWIQFDGHLDQLLYASEAAARRIAESVPDKALPEKLRDVEYTGPTEILRISPQRRAQRFFRETVLASYNYRCAVSGIDKLALLNASHIIPWSEERERRADPRNGISLSTLHDRAFDRGLITFDEQLGLVASSSLKNGNPNKVIRAAILEFEGKPLETAERFNPDPVALNFHRERVFVR